MTLDQLRVTDGVFNGQLADLPTPLARAHALADLIAVVVHTLDQAPDDVPDFLAAYMLTTDELGVRDTAFLPSGLTDEQQAEAIVFVCSLVTCNREVGLDLTRWCTADEPVVVITSKRLTPTEAGFGKLAVLMMESIGIAEPTSFAIAEPDARNDDEPKPLREEA